MTKSGTRMELRTRFPIMNRSEFFPGPDGKEKRTFVCNLTEMADGQVPPLFTPDMDTSAQSKL